jgi:hypothetical protein
VNQPGDSPGSIVFKIEVYYDEEEEAIFIETGHNKNIALDLILSIMETIPVEMNKIIRSHIIPVEEFNGSNKQPEGVSESTPQLSGDPGPETH